MIACRYEVLPVAGSLHLASRIGAILQDMIYTSTLAASVFAPITCTSNCLLRRPSRDIFTHLLFLIPWP